MRKLKVLLSTLAILSLALFPAAGAMFQLGAGLDALERMRSAQAAAPSPDREVVGTYEVDPSTLEASVRFRRVAVLRGDRGSP